jgi:hypothetical protein
MRTFKRAATLAAKFGELDDLVTGGSAERDSEA